MYLYVLKSDVLKRVPPELLVAFGTPYHAFDLVLSPERALAREDIHQVLANLDKQGYHLQMPRQKTSTSSTCQKSCFVAMTRCDRAVAAQPGMIGVHQTV